MMMMAESWNSSVTALNSPCYRMLLYAVSPFPLFLLLAAAAYAPGTSSGIRAWR